MQLEEELYRARYLLNEGDAAAFLPSKSHGDLNVPWFTYVCLYVDFWFC